MDRQELLQGDLLSSAEVDQFQVDIFMINGVKLTGYVNRHDKKFVGLTRKQTSKNMNADDMTVVSKLHIVSVKLSVT